MTQALVRRFTPAETKMFIERTMNTTISEGYIYHIRADIKRDKIAELNILRKDQYVFVQECFWNRINEWSEMQRTLYDAIANESSKQEDRDNDVIVHAVNSLNDISDKLFQAYTWLANVAHGMTQQQPPYPIEPEPLPSPINPSQPYPTELHHDEKEPIL
jgi:macrodomain Ter protein organizer (MatP/YcbG family)